MKRKTPVGFSRLSGYSTEGKAALFTLGLAYLYLIVEILYKFKFKEEVCTWELLLLFLLFAAFGLFKKGFSSNRTPVDFKGVPLPTDGSDASHRAREAYYKKAARLYGVVFAGVNLLALYVSSTVSHLNLGMEFFEIRIPNIVLALLASVILYFIIYYFAYMIDYLWYENRIASQDDTPETYPVIKEESSLKDPGELPQEPAAEPVETPVQEPDDVKKPAETEVKNGPDAPPAEKKRPGRPRKTPSAGEKEAAEKITAAKKTTATKTTATKTTAKKTET